MVLYIFDKITIVLGILFPETNGKLRGLSYGFILDTNNKNICKKKTFIEMVNTDP